MKISGREPLRSHAKSSSQSNLRNKFRNDSARFREPATVHKQDVPILSDSLLRRIDHARHLNNQNSQIQNLPLLPILKTFESRRVLSSSKSGRQNLGSARQLSARNKPVAPTPTPSKKLPKSTKISAFNNNSLSTSKPEQPTQINHSSSQISTAPTSNSISGLIYVQKPNTVMGLSNQYEMNNQKPDPNHNKNISMEEMLQTNGFNKFNDIKQAYQSNQQLNSNQSQSSLLRSLRNDTENTNLAEIFVRPTPIKPVGKYDEGINKKMNQNIALTPLIKNFRLNSFDFHGEFNMEKHVKNTQILKPLNDFNLKSNNKLSNKNYELALNGPHSAKPQISKQSINYLAAGILNPKNTHNFNGSSHSSLSRKLDLDDFEYYDVQELFKRNNQLKSGLFRKKLSQINEESTIDGTPLTNSRWSSSLSNYSAKTGNDDEVENDIWSDIDEVTNLPKMSARQKKSDITVAVQN